MTALVGDLLELSVGPPAHGGHCVARDDGLVVFVRHALPGERVIAAVTEVRRGYLRADAVKVLDASPDRVDPPCPYAHADGCGGCDLQHVSLVGQRKWKAAIVREHLGLDVDVVPVGDSLGWRSRVRYTVSLGGRAGLLKHRSHEVVPIDRCLIAHPAIQALPVLSQTWSEDSVSTVASSTGEVVVGPGVVHETALGRTWTLPTEVFWQVHPAAPAVLASAVLELLAPRPGEVAWDLYGGAGLFAAALSSAVGASGRVTLVESSRAAASVARSMLSSVEVVHSRVETALRRMTGPVDLVVLDPPRSGAGAAVVRALAAAGPRAIAYVACDPAAFARDVRTFGDLGWQLSALRAYDLFPMTHHVECIGLLTAGHTGLIGSKSHHLPGPNAVNRARVENLT